MKKNAALFFVLSFLSTVLLGTRLSEAKLPKEVYLRLVDDQGQKLKVIDLYKKYLLPHSQGFNVYSGFLESKKNLYKDVKFSLVPQSASFSPNLVVYFQDRDINKKVFLALLVNNRILFFDEKFGNALQVADANEFLKGKLAFYSEFSKIKFLLSKKTQCNSFVDKTDSPNRYSDEDELGSSSSESGKSSIRGFLEGVKRFNTSDDSVLLPHERRNVSIRDEENSASERSNFDDIF